jgi:hypothetical protein
MTIGEVGSPITYQAIMEVGLSDAQKNPTQSQENELSPATEILYRGLGQLAQEPLLDDVVDEVLAYHQELWSWKRDQWTSQNNDDVKVLYRDIAAHDTVPKLPNPTDRRKVFNSGKNLLLLMPQILAADIHDVIDFERQKPQEVSKPRYAPEALRLAEVFRQHWKFRDTDRSYKAQPDDRFTVVESAALGLLTHVDTHEEMADLVGVVRHATIARLLQPIAEQYGAAKSPTKLMLIALAAGAATVNHVEAGKSTDIKPVNLEFIQAYFAKDPKRRQLARSTTGGTIGAHFSRACQAIGVKGRKNLVKHLVRDNLIDLPDLDSGAPV